jgi:MoaA/NifB/PqqE/SkfB family radical SAM enzyme
MVAVTGGEPLVRQDLFDVLSQVNALGFPWGMVTNGMLVNDKIIEKCVNTGMRTVSVSLDGIGETHNWLRSNKESYNKAVNALSSFVNSGCFEKVEAITCVNERNISQLDEIYELLKGIGANGWRLFTIFPKGRAQENKGLTINSDILIRLLQFIKEKRQLV